MVIFPPHASRLALNQYDAVLWLWDLNVTEHKYAARHPNAGFACNFNDLGELDPYYRNIGSEEWSGYHFEVQCPQGSGEAKGYKITAVPVKAGKTGNLAFCTDQSRGIWYSKKGLISDCLAMRNPVE
jgi:hypothetical protein